MSLKILQDSESKQDNTKQEEIEQAQQSLLYAALTITQCLGEKGKPVEEAIELAAINNLFSTFYTLHTIGISPPEAIVLLATRLVKQFEKDSNNSNDTQGTRETLQEITNRNEG